MQADAEHVDARREHLGRDAGEERPRGAVRDHDVPLPVDDDARVRIVGVEQAGERGACARAWARRRGRGASSAGAYPAASSIVLRARSGTSSRSASASTSSGLGFDRPVSTKLRWRGRHAHLVREVHLAAPPLGAPLLHQVADRLRCAMRPRVRCARVPWRLPHGSSHSRAGAPHDGRGAVDERRPDREEAHDRHDTLVDLESTSTPTSPATASPTPDRRLELLQSAWSADGRLSTRRSTAPGPRASPRWSTRCSATTPTTRSGARRWSTRTTPTPATAGSSWRPTARSRSSGTDVVTLDADGRIATVVGFFGDLAPAA